jgi:hypothetical protein
VDVEWDPAKARRNLAKHGITFEEAVTIFGDPYELTIPDPDHSVSEERYVSIGTSRQGRLLVAGYTERGGNIRLIFARRATSRERMDYELG